MLGMLIGLDQLSTRHWLVDVDVMSFGLRLVEHKLSQITSSAPLMTVLIAITGHVCRVLLLSLFREK